MKKIIKSKLLVLFAIGIFVCGAIAVLFYFGILKFNNPSKEQYPVRGIDVSHYQGHIDWDILSQQGIYFAFIKATEGSSFVDEYFETNFRNALSTDLRVGAYHFFSFDSSGEAQAENFISHVPTTNGTLPPVVDFEFYADKESNLPNAEEARKNLNTLLDKLESHYGVKPIIYATEKSYDTYLFGHYESYDIWIRNVFTTPKPLENQTWLFWQYTNREHLEGYSGAEYFIDMNVFAGTMEDFINYGK